MKGLRSTDLQLQNSHGDAKYRMWNIANNTVMAVYSVRWALDLSGCSLHSYINVYSLCCTPETNVILYVNCN